MYGHITKKAVSAYVFFPVIERRVGLGTLIFGPKTGNFGDPHFSQAFFLWKPIHRRERYRPEKEEMDLRDVVQQRDSWV